ncbi:class I SAM-dependent methyltransferase [Myxococcus fulvus]|uniref:class I SAM-dependent methyltransferase n=1 Tax=Myxococcus fulvus TaxID=33 RepID=UPI003B9ABF82
MTAAVNLTGVPETMLWTLHNRATEARRADTFLHDPACVRIYESIAYDFERSFGKADGSHPMRSRVFDDVVRPWMAAHPGGTVVELGVGLETQLQRCDDGRVRWVCVDVPEALAVRERFLPPSERCRHVARSALDLAWMDEVDASKGVFVSAQGLLMYFDEAQVRRLLLAIVERFPGVELMFDVIPRWFSKKTLQGFHKTKHYRAPPMPWGVNRDEVEPLLRSWSARVTAVRSVSYGLYARGVAGAVLRLFSQVPVLRNLPPAIVHVKTVAP